MTEIEDAYLMSQTDTLDMNVCCFLLMGDRLFVLENDWNP